MREVRDPGGACRGARRLRRRARSRQPELRPARGAEPRGARAQQGRSTAPSTARWRAAYGEAVPQPVRRRHHQPAQQLAAAGAGHPVRAAGPRHRRGEVDDALPGQHAPRPRRAARHRHRHGPALRRDQLRRDLLPLGRARGRLLELPLVGPGTQRDWTGYVLDQVLDPTWYVLPGGGGERAARARRARPRQRPLRARPGARRAAAQVRRQLHRAADQLHAEHARAAARAAPTSISWRMSMPTNERRPAARRAAGGLGAARGSPRRWPRRRAARRHRPGAGAGRRRSPGS